MASSIDKVVTSLSAKTRLCLDFSPKTVHLAGSSYRAVFLDSNCFYEFRA